MKPLCRYILKCLCKGAFCFSILFLISYSSIAQSNFQKLYARTTTVGVSGINATKQLADGSFILAAGIAYCHNCQSEGLMIKIDANGDTLWTRIMGGIRDDTFDKVLQAADGNYIFVGQTTSFGKQATTNVYGYYLYAVKINSNGDTLWTKTYGGINTDYAHNNNLNAVQATLDGGFIMLSDITLQTHTPYSINPMLIKCNANGDTLWTKIYSSSKTLNFSKIIQTQNDSGYIAIGNIQPKDTTPFIPPGSQGSDALLSKLDKYGNILWTKTYGGINDEAFNAMEQTSMGDYITTGFSISYDTNNNSHNYIYALRLNSLFDTLWTNMYGPLYSSNYMKIQNDSTFVLFGQTAAGVGGILALKINANTGVNTYTQLYGPNESIGEPDITNDGGFIIPGSTIDYGSSYGEGYLIKTDSLGNSGCNQYVTNLFTKPTQTLVQTATLQTKYYPINVNSTQTKITRGIAIGTLCSSVGIKQLAVNSNQIAVYPNPAGNYIMITSTQDISEIKVFDVLGKGVLNTKEKEIDVSNLQAGVYFIQVKASDKTYTAKFIKE
jgi:hypothetical protein